VYRIHPRFSGAGEPLSISLDPEHPTPFPKICVAPLFRFYVTHASRTRSIITIFFSDGGALFVVFWKKKNVSASALIIISAGAEQKKTPPMACLFIIITALGPKVAASLSDIVIHAAILLYKV